MKVDLISIFQHSLLVFLTAIISCDTANNVDSPDDKYFVKYYGEDGDQHAVDMVVNNNDGTVMLLGYSTAGAKTIFVVKTDAEGQVLWQKKFGTPSDIPKDIEQTLDGNFVVLSDFENSNNNSTDVKLIRFTAEGVKLDSVIIDTEASGLHYDDHSKSVTPISDGGFIVTGSADFDEPQNQAVVLSSFFHFRCDNNLTLLDINDWTRYYAAGETNVGVKTFENTTTGKYYVFGYSDTNSNGKYVLVYYALDANGTNATQPVTLGDATESTEANHIIHVPNSLLDGYFMVSTSTNKLTLTSKLHVSKLKEPLKFNLNDDKQFDTNVYGGKRLEGVYATSCVKSQPIGYLVLSNEIKETGETDVLLSKIDQNGGELWAVNFGSTNNDRAAAVAELQDGRILVFCTIETIVQTKMALFKLNSKGQLLN